MMNFNEMLEGLKQDKKYRRECWNNDIYIYINGINDDICYKNYAGSGFCLEDFDATDWVEVVNIK